MLGGTLSCIVSRHMLSTIGGKMFGFGRKKQRLKESRVAVLVADGVEQVLLDEPVRALRKAGVDVFLLAPQAGTIRAMRDRKPGDKIPVDVALQDVHPASFAALLIPGGMGAIERLRRDAQVVAFVRSFAHYGKPIATLGYAPLLLASAGLVQGRRVTSWPGIREDLLTAGAIWVDAPYMLDDILLTGRDPRAFSKQMVQLVGEVVAV